MADASYKQHDTRPDLVLYLTEGDPASPTVVDLTTLTSARLLLRSGSTTVTRACTVTSAAGGVLTVRFVSPDTDINGDYQGEVELTWSDGGIETFPNDGYLAITILDDIA